VQLLPVQLGGPAVVLLLGVLSQAVVTAEEGAGLSISSELHLSELLPAPVGVQVGGADEGQVDTQGPVNTTAVNADEDAVGDGGPGGVLCTTVIATFISRSRAESFEDLHDVILSRSVSHGGGGV